MQFRLPRAYAAALSLTFALLLSPLAAPAATTGTGARAEKSRFDIPAEDLGKALRDFAIQANCNLSYDPASVEHLKAPAIKGDFTVPDALSLILRGTHLRAVNINENTIQVLDRAASTSDSNSALTGAVVRLAYATPDAQQPSSQTVAAPPTSSSTTSDDNKTPGLEEIVVTGTNISGVENKTVPLLTFDRDAIERSGYATAADFITSLPQNVKSGGNSPDGVLAPNGFGFGNIENSTGANLRGLGSSSTLTLLNGHRVAPSAYGSGVDLSIIPLNAVERIEVLTDGSSAVYGSDAVGGVINIILRKDFDGAETSARLDTLARGGGELKQISQSLGKTWGSGGALAVLEFQDTDAIRSDERSFTGNLPRPTDVFPESKRYSGTLTAHQSLGASFELFADALIEHNDGLRAVTLGGFTTQTQLITSKTNSASANTGFRWQPFGDWHLEGDALFSQVDTLASEVFTPPNFGYTNGTPELRNLDTIKEADLKLDGTLWSSGGSSLKAALGASYRQEDFSSLVEYTNLDRPTNRHIHAVFAEFYAPLVTAANALPGMQKLDLSAAVRNDSYSDFGSKVNPRFGVFWSPIDQIGLRAAYSTSFRAPNPIEIISNTTATSVYIQSGFPQPQDPSGNTGVIFFGNRVLGPETSRNLSAGLDFTPAALPNTRFSLNYYRIIYSNRIISSPDAANVFLNPQIYGPLIQRFPNDAAVEAFVAGIQPPQTLVDLTPNHTGLTGVRFGFPYGDINAAKESTQGLDLGAHSILNLDASNKLILDFNATYIKDIETNFCNSCVGTDLVDTYGQPLKLRLRAAAGWSDGIFSSNAAVNYANAYSDTNLIPPGRIAAFTTVDLNASWHIRASGTTLAFNIINALNSGPPLTGPGLNKVAYDPINADPRARILSFQVRQAW
jgi:outer membrane receptor protein involved in Fe transport